jgi:hypothetical protein
VRVGHLRPLKPQVCRRRSYSYIAIYQRV